MKTYEAIYEPKKVKGVYGISLVENPAMEGLFIALSEQTEIQLKEVDKEQRILMGLILEPNKPVYRNQNGEEFNIVFSENTVKELSHGFFKHNNHSNSKIEHTGSNIKGVTFVESWIVENPEIDKSANFGFSYPKGSWIGTMKIDDDSIWNDYVKTGKVQGFSIDAMINLREINLKSEIEMSKENENTLIEFLKDLPSRIAIAMKGEPKQDEPEVEVKTRVTAIQLGEVQTEDKNVTILHDGETMEVGGKVWILAEDGTEVKLPVGSYKLDGGKILVVTEEGIIAEVKEATAEEAPAEQKPAEMTVAETDATAKAIENAIKSIMIKYKADFDTELQAIKTELKADYDKQILELSNQPARTPIRSSPQQAEPKNSKERLQNAINNVKN